MKEGRKESEAAAPATARATAEATGQATAPAKPCLVAIDMGYGHLRPAHSLAQLLRTEVLQCDRAPLAQPQEERLWRRVRLGYEAVSRLSQLPVLGRPFAVALDEMTAIPHLHPFRDLSRPTWSVHALERLIAKGLGRGMVERLRASGAPLLTTYFVPAIVADSANLDRVYCVVTDSDINRLWVPSRAAQSRVHFLAPSARVQSRLRAYGVKDDRIELTGFPLPPSLLGGKGLFVAKRNLAARLVRLDPQGRFRQSYRDELKHFLGDLPENYEGQPPRLVFAIGGAGAQAELVRHFLNSFAPLLRSGRLRLSLVAGVRREVGQKLEEWIAEQGLDSTAAAVDVLLAADHATYFSRFNALLGEADVLWTKPSEMSFYAALGLPLILSAPVGAHERYNRRWVIEQGAGFRQRDPRYAADWIAEWLEEGSLAAAAWSGFMRLPKFGVYRIAEKLGTVAD